MKGKISISALAWIRTKKEKMTTLEWKLFFLLSAKFYERNAIRLIDKSHEEILTFYKKMRGDDLRVHVTYDFLKMKLNGERIPRIISVMENAKFISCVFDFEEEKGLVVELEKEFLKNLMMGKAGSVIIGDEILKLKRTHSYSLAILSKRYNESEINVEDLKFLSGMQKALTKKFFAEMKESIKEIRKVIDWKITITKKCKGLKVVSGQKIDAIGFKVTEGIPFSIYTRLTIEELKNKGILPKTCDDILHKLNKKIGDYYLMIVLLTIKKNFKTKVRNLKSVINLILKSSKDVELLNKIKEDKEKFNKLTENELEKYKEILIKADRIRAGSKEELSSNDAFEIEYTLEKITGKYYQQQDFINMLNNYTNLAKNGKVAMELPLTLFKLEKEGKEEKDGKIKLQIQSSNSKQDWTKYLC